ncbi:MAG: ATP F0F1 synthase subunit B [Deltaproteobacteria bacterium]
MKKLFVLTALLATPAFAAETEHHAAPFLSLFNTNFVVLIAFLAFVGILLYVGVPAMLNKVLDGRAAGIRKDLADARAIRDEAQALLDSFAAKRREVEAMTSRIVDTARDEAQTASNKAKDELTHVIARRLKTAEDQIASAQAAAIKDVRDTAAQVAVAVAGEVMAKNMSAADGSKLIDSAIAEVEAKLH